MLALVKAASSPIEVFPSTKLADELPKDSAGGFRVQFQAAGSRDKMSAVSEKQVQKS